MRSIKMLGLAAVALLAALALIGPASASASVVCLDSSNPCTNAMSTSSTGNANWLFGDLAKQSSAATNEVATLSGFSGGVNVNCSTTTEDSSTGEGSFLQGALTANSPSPAGNVSMLNWNNCTRSSGGSCTATSNGLPWNGAITASDTPLTAGSDGTLTVTMGTGQFVEVVCGTAPFTVTCDYTAGTGVRASLYNPGNANRPDQSTGEDASHAQAFFNGVTLTGTGTHNCGTGTWTANYAMFHATSVGGAETDVWIR